MHKVNPLVRDILEIIRLGLRHIKVLPIISLFKRGSSTAIYPSGCFNSLDSDKYISFELR